MGPLADGSIGLMGVAGLGGMRQLCVCYPTDLVKLGQNSYLPNGTRSFLVPEIVIRQAWRIHFVTQGYDFGSSGVPWEAKRSAEGTRWGLELDFRDLG